MRTRACVLVNDCLQVLVDWLQGPAGAKYKRAGRIMFLSNACLAASYIDRLEECKDVLQRLGKDGITVVYNALIAGRHFLYHNNDPNQRHNLQRFPPPPICYLPE